MKKITICFWLLCLCGTRGLFALTIAQNGFSATANGITTNVTFLKDNIVRVYKYPAASNPKKESKVVKAGLHPVGKIIVSGSKEGREATNAFLKVVYKKESSSLQFLTPSGDILAAELPAGGSFSDADNDGVASFKAAQAFKFTDDEAIYGFGQQQNGKLNQRYEKLLLRQRNMSIAVPFFQSSKGYGIYWDNYSLTNYDPVADGGKLTSEIGDCIDYYFVVGKNADEVVRGYRRLTGEVPMLPLWSFGYIQSKERYRSQQELVDVVRKYRQLQVPLDAVIQDWQYWGEDNLRWNAVDFTNPRFPDPAAAIDSIHQMHAKVLISVWPSFGSKTAIYKAMDRKQLLLNFYTFPVTDSVKVYDAFNPEARNLYWSYMKKNLYSKGIDGWWLDATEPVQKEVTKTISKAGEHEMAYKDQLASVAQVKTFSGSFKSVGNLFPYETVKAVYDGQRKTAADKRVLILTRSAFAGQQATGSVLWSGDVTSSWDVLKTQVPAALNLSLSGMPYWNSDIGGFFSGRKYPAGLKDPRYKELYLRWLQFAVFTAMMRSHGTNAPREIYQLGSKGNPAFDIAEKYIRLRYELQSYIYTASWNVTHEGASLMRPLLMDYAADSNVRNVGGAYLFGQSILVNPVTDSITAKNENLFDDQSRVRVSTYLPKGAWYDFWTDKKHSGGTLLWQELSIAQMPLFVKAGSIIPFAGVAQYSSIKNFRDLVIKVYPGKDAVFTLYEDEGDNYNYEKGSYSLIGFRWDERTKTLTVLPRQGKFPGMIPERNFRIRFAGTGIVKNIIYKGGKITVRF